MEVLSCYSYGPYTLHTGWNRIPVTMSGIHMDHRGNKNFSPSDTVQMNVDIMIAELKNGNCDPT